MRLFRQRYSIIGPNPNSKINRSSSCQSRIIGARQLYDQASTRNPQRVQLEMPKKRASFSRRKYSDEQKAEQVGRNFRARVGDSTTGHSPRRAARVSTIDAYFGVLPSPRTTTTQIIRNTHGKVTHVRCCCCCANACAIFSPRPQPRNLSM